MALNGVLNVKDINQRVTFSLRISPVKLFPVGIVVINSILTIECAEPRAKERKQYGRL